MAGRVAYLSNMNNNGFALVRYLRDRGIEADVFCFPYEPKHFQPAADTFGTDAEAFVHFPKWGDGYDLNSFSKDQLASELARFDVLIGAGTAPAYVERAGRTLDAFIPYGEDIRTLPHRRLARPLSLIPRQRLRAYQRCGIQKARHIIMDDAAQNFVSCLQRVHPRGIWHRLTPPALYLPEYRRDILLQHAEKSTYLARFKSIRESSDLVIFSHSRHSWVPDPKTPDWIRKGNDHIIRGLKIFADRNPDMRVKFITFEYGPDVLASKQLIEEIGASSLVEWFPLSPRREIMLGLMLSDIGVGEIHESCFSYGVMLEVLAVGLPFVGRCDPEAIPKQDMYPMANVHNTDEFAAFLESYRTDRSRWIAAGAEAKNWLNRQIDKTLEVVTKICTTPTAQAF